MNAETQSCPLCGALDNLLRCSRCKGTYYCSKEHQRLHWKEHRRQCRRRVADENGAPTADDDELEASTAAADNNNKTAMADCGEDVDESRGRCPGIDTLSTRYAHLSTNGPPSAVVQVVDSVEPGSPPPYLHRSPRLVPSEMPTSNSLWMQTMCQYVIRDMDRYGICVIDNFAGRDVGTAIVDEVQALYGSGRFMDGELVNRPSGNACSRTIRGDKIAWVNGTEAGCTNIGYLIRLVDAIVINSNKMPRNGKLGEYNISNRTMAMVACYPGNGTQYVKHVDNPNKDGRCITCIYYLNKDWDVERDGGLLRIFPKGWKTSVADIDPTFDRILLFWSDRRNPHEVQPALRTRYAITLWYYDKREREAARQLRPDDRWGAKRQRYS